MDALNRPPYGFTLLKRLLMVVSDVEYHISSKFVIDVVLGLVMALYNILPIKIYINRTVYRETRKIVCKQQQQQQHIYRKT